MEHHHQRGESVRAGYWVAVFVLAVVSAHQYAFGNFASFQATATVAACASGFVDAVPASAGAYTWGASFRKIRAAYVGSAVQLQRTTDNATQDVGFSGCDLASATSFCTFATLSVSTVSARVALPAGTSIFVYNANYSPSGAAVYFAVGNSSVAATTSNTVMPLQSGQWVTVGANTHIAAITAAGSGDGINAPVNTIELSNCGVRTWYDQINSANATQTTQANQLAFFPDIMNGKPGMVGNGNGALNGGSDGGTCSMAVADSATYKTTTVHMFAMVQVGIPSHTNANWKVILGYPFNSSADATTYRWGVMQESNPDILLVNVNASTQSFNNQEGLGAVFRSQPYIYDYSTGNGIVRYLNTTFATLGTASITYPNAVGLSIGGDASGHGCGNIAYGELLIANATQTTPANQTANMATYWSVAAPSAAITTSDGFTWTKTFIGGFPPPSGYESVNGVSYATEGDWSAWSQYAATNVKTSGTTALGDMHRFEIRGTDEVWGDVTGNRQELDGSVGTALVPLNTTIWIAYAFQLESGYPTVSANTGGWNIPGQMHIVDSGATNPHSVASNFYFNVWDNTLSLVKDDPSNPGCTPFVNCQTTVWSSASNFVQPGTPIQIVLTAKKSTSGTADTFTVNVNGTQVYTCSGSCFWVTNTAWFWKFGIYRGAYSPYVTIIKPQAWRYCNMQVTTSSLSAQIATPLDACSQHNFLLKRDIDPAANDNAPMWLNIAA